MKLENCRMMRVCVAGDERVVARGRLTKNISDMLLYNMLCKSANSAGQH